MAARKILLVDDDPDILKVLSMRLEKTGYEVDIASDGLVALEKIHKDRPDLIVLDLMLPEVEGYKVCRMLKFDETYKDIPVIILTGRTQEEDRNKGMQMGADAYMVKPFESKDLLIKIEKLLEER